MSIDATEKILTSSKQLPSQLVSRKYAGLNVLGLVADNSACGHYRVINPLHYLKLNGANVHYGSYHSMDTFLKYDYIVAPRQHNPEVYEILRFAMWEGKTVIYEIDDDLDAVEPTSPAYYAYHPGSKELKWIHKVMSWCDGVTTTTHEMARWCSQNNRNVAIIPNYIDFSFRDWRVDVRYDENQDPILTPLPIEKPKEWEGKVVIGYQGGTCLSQDTEILTENGWKLIKELLPNEKVATLVPETGLLEYHVPSEYVNVPYKGKMHLVEQKQVNFCVTPNHWMWASLGKVKSSKYLKIQSENLLGRTSRISKTCKWQGKNSSTVLVGSKIFDTKDFMKILGFWIGDGWTSSSSRIQDGKTYPRYEIGFVQKKDPAILSEIKSIFEKYDLYFKYTNDGKYLRLQNKELWEYFNKLGKAAEKYIPKDILELSTEYLKILLDWYIKADGSISKDSGKITAYTVSKRLSDNLTEVALKTGMAANVKKIAKRDITSICGHPAKANYSSYIISFLRSGLSKGYLNPVVTKDSIKEVDYDGTIHCVTVKNHLIYVRRNGKPMWTGNTHQTDVPILGAQIKKILEKHDNAHFAIYMSPVQAKEFIDTYQIPEGRYTYVQARHFLDHPSGLHGVDIALAPLQVNQFNLAKSNLKILEAFASNAAIVTSNVGPYARFNQKYPDYAIVAGNGAGCQARNLFEGMDYLLQNPDVLAEKKIKGRQLVLDHFSLEKNIAKWPSTWKVFKDLKFKGEVGPPEKKKPRKEYTSFGLAGPNDPCPCQSGRKYKSCCKDAFG